MTGDEHRNIQTKATQQNLNRADMTSIQPAAAAVHQWLTDLCGGSICGFIDA